MTCPICDGKTEVTNVRTYFDHVIRYRKCQKCRFIFRTIEMDDDLYNNLNKEKHKNADHQKTR